MIKLNRTTEYGLIALRHMRLKVQTNGLTSAREIADCYGLPFEITAKTLQRLKDSGFIESAQGAKGGYMIKRSLAQVTLGEFLNQMEGPVSVVACAEPAAQKAGCECEYNTRCELKDVMSVLNRRVHIFLAGISLAELTDVPFEGVPDSLKTVLSVPAVALGSVHK